MEKEKLNNLGPISLDLKKAFNEIGFEIEKPNPFKQPIQKASSTPSSVERELLDLRTEKENWAKREKQLTEEITSLKANNNNLEKGVKELEIGGDFINNLQSSYISLQKGLTSLKAELGEVNKMKKELNSSNKRINEAIATSLENQDNLTLLIKGIDSKINLIGSTPLPRKSMTKDFQERQFQGSNNSNATVLDRRANRAEILTILESKAGDLSKGVEHTNPLYLDALQNYEASYTLSQTVLEDLRKLKIEIVN